MTTETTVYNQVKEIIETGKDIEVWQGLGADEKTLKQRKIILDKFLIQISTEREKPKRRVKQKFEFTTIELVKAVAPDNNKVFEASEFYRVVKAAVMDLGYQALLQAIIYPHKGSCGD